MVPVKGEADFTFTVEPEGASIYYKFIPVEADADEVEYELVGEEGTITLGEDGVVYYYAETENGRSATQWFSVRFPLNYEGPIHISAYIGEELIANGATVSPAEGETSITVKFECDNPDATLFYTYFTKEEGEKDYHPVPADGVVTFDHNGIVKYYAATSQFASPAYNFTIDMLTGIGSIEAADAEATYYDLQGCRVNGQLQPGVYVEIKDGKAVKRVIR